MKSTFTYIAIFTLLVALAIGLIYRGTRSSSHVEQAASLFGKGMPPSLMTQQSHTGIDLDPDSWLQLGGSFQNVKAGDLVEVDEPEGQYILSITLLWRDQEISTQSRYFRSHPGPDGQIEGRPFEYLGCAMSSRGFFSGYCECSGISSTKVAVDPNWTFDDRDNNVVSKFKQSFVATLNGSGSVDCENEAKISWRVEDKAVARTGQFQREPVEK